MLCAAVVLHERQARISNTRSRRSAGREHIQINARGITIKQQGQGHFYYSVYTSCRDYYKHTSPEHVVRLFFSQQTAAAHTHTIEIMLCICMRPPPPPRREVGDGNDQSTGRAPRRQYIKKSTERSHVRIHILQHLKSCCHRRHCSELYLCMYITRAHLCER
jgi:hypothetical protein